MSATDELPQVGTTPSPLAHPLDPLSPAEVVRAVAIVREQRGLGAQLRFAAVVLREPPKDLVLGYKQGDPIDRQAFLSILDNNDGAVYEALVSLSQAAVISWHHIPGVQPPIMLDEFLECENAVKAHPEFQAALRRRGIGADQLALVTVDPWSAGNFGFGDEEGLRISRTLAWIRQSANDNSYAHPIEGLIALVDLNTMQVIRVEDHGVVPVPQEPGNYAAEFIGAWRSDLRPLEIIQPEGPSFTLSGHELRWQKWRMRLGFTPREGLVLYTIGYEDQGRLRPIIYRASLAEMVVPYGDPAISHFRKNAFDVGEYGVGMLANSLKLGCDCLGEIRYVDAVVNSSRGDAVVLQNAICIHEEDYGILWKHYDWRTEQTEVRRSRRLVVSFIATVGNYEYGFFWYFYQDGTIQYEVKLSGILSTGAVEPGIEPKYGTLVAPGLNAPIHQHFFNVRLDMSVDGMQNSIYEVNTEAEPLGPENPYGNAFYARSTLLATEQAAQRLVDPLTGRFWKIVNPSLCNRMGQPVGYKLVSAENVLPFAHPESSLIRRAGFITKHLWVTPYAPGEQYAAGDYPNQHCGGDGLPRWTQADRSVENTDIVVWYTFGHHHIARAEDWPVMPVGYTGFMLKPVNFFEANPALDVPPPIPAGDHCCH